MGSIDRFVYRLGDPELAAIDEMLEKTRDIPTRDVTRREFDHPRLTPMLADIFETLVNGRGVVLVRGVTPGRYSEHDLERIQWGFCTHWGSAARRGLPDARAAPEKPVGTESSFRRGSAIALHTDFHALTSLVAVERAASGGHIRVASALAVHNAILATRPELLPALYRGYFYASPGGSTRVARVTSDLIPVFSSVEGQLSCAYARPCMNLAAARLGETLPPDLTEALDYFDEVAQRDGIGLRFAPEPGEMLACNNLVALHGRTGYRDSPAHARRVLRLCLDVPTGRQVMPALLRLAEHHEAPDL